MGPMVKRVVVVVLVGCTFVVWNERTDHDVIVAQRRTPIVVTRIYTGPDGQTHAEQIDVKLTPGGSSGELSEMAKVTGLQFRAQPPNTSQDGHPPPRRRTSTNRPGQEKIELGGQKKTPGTGNTPPAGEPDRKGQPPPCGREEPNNPSPSPPPGAKQREGGAHGSFPRLRKDEITALGPENKKTTPYHPF